MKIILLCLLLTTLAAAGRTSYKELPASLLEEEGVAITVRSEAEDVFSPNWKPWRTAPGFLVGMSNPAQEEYKEIKWNRELTKAEKTDKLKAWAKKHGKETQMAEFLDKLKDQCARKKVSRRDDYNRLGELMTSANAILDDESNTWKSSLEKLSALVAGEKQEVRDAFFSLMPFVKRELRTFEEEKPKPKKTSSTGTTDEDYRIGDGAAVAVDQVYAGGRANHHNHRTHRVMRHIGGGAQPKHHQGGERANIGSGVELYYEPSIEISLRDRKAPVVVKNYDPYGKQKSNHHHHH